MRKPRYQAAFYKCVEDEVAEDWGDYFDSLRECVESAQEVADASEWRRIVIERTEDVATYTVQSKWVKL